MVDILYEDNHIIVCVKPQNVPTQEDESGDEDMLTILKKYIKEKENKSGNVFLGLVHRLDRPTGGVMVFAKTSKAASRLCEQIKNGDFSKKYYACLVGSVRFKQQTLVNYLKKDIRTNKVVIVPQSIDGAKRAELKYQIIGEYEKQISLADIELLTGRSHQIRVQMSNMGNPVFGDTKYGGDIIKNQNLALWAYSLTFIHPTTKQKMTFKIYPPKEIKPWSYFEKELFVNN